LALAPTGKILRVAGATGRILQRTPANNDRIIRETPAAVARPGRHGSRVGYLCAVLAFAGAAVYASSTPLLPNEAPRVRPARADSAAHSSIIDQAKKVAAHYSNATFVRAVYEPLPERQALGEAPVAALQPAALLVPTERELHTAPKEGVATQLSPKRRSAAMALRVENIIKYYAPKGVDPKHLATRIVRESEAQGYDPLFVAAVIKSESMFNTMARSHVGARGLMQIMPATGKWLAGKHRIDRLQLHDTEQNLKLGIAYLKELEAGYNGDKVMTLVAYNWGPGHVQMAGRGKRRIPGDVMRYAVKILNDYRRWRGEAPPLRAFG